MLFYCFIVLLVCCSCFKVYSADEEGEFLSNRGLKEALAYLGGESDSLLETVGSSLPCPHSRKAKYFSSNVSAVKSEIEKVLQKLNTSTSIQTPKQEAEAFILIAKAKYILMIFDYTVSLEYTENTVVEVLRYFISGLNSLGFIMNKGKKEFLLLVHQFLQCQSYLNLLIRNSYEENIDEELFDLLSVVNQNIQLFMPSFESEGVCEISSKLLDTIKLLNEFQTQIVQSVNDQVGTNQPLKVSCKRGYDYIEGGSCEWLNDLMRGEWGFLHQQLLFDEPCFEEKARRIQIDEACKFKASNSKKETAGENCTCCLPLISLLSKARCMALKAIKSVRSQQRWKVWILQKPVFN